MPQPTDNMPPSQHCLARALYDNIPDSPDELAFRRGDTMIVLEQNTANIEGWWLCSLRGRQGICPANRLRLIPGVFEDTGQRVCSPQFTTTAEISSSGDFNCLQRQGKRRSWHVQPNQVVTPKKFNDVYLYDMPPGSRCSPSMSMSPQPPSDCYDVPPRAIPISSDPRLCPRCSPSPIGGESYDVPRPLQAPLTPSSSASSLTADSVGSSNRSSLVQNDYDVPRPSPRPVLTNATSLTHQTQQQQNIYDVPPQAQPIKELPLELNSALETLDRLQTDTASSIAKILGFVGPKWRTREKLDTNLLEIKLAVIRLKTSLHDLAEFCEGTLGNATRATDKNLATKLAPLVSSLKKSDSLVGEATAKLGEHRWAIDLLARTEDDDNQDDQSRKPDELDHLVACSKALIEDIRQTASFIQGNGLLLFKKEPQHPDDYDYVSIDTKETVSKKHTDIKDSLPKDLKQGYEELVKHADDVVTFDCDRQLLDADDKHIINFFAGQLITHHTNLTHAIDAFLKTVEHNQPPKLFLAHGKFVVLSAHKLVHIGDTVHRNVSCKELRERALNCANALSDALATSVAKTKMAALQFPSVSAVQEMVDSIVDISYSARDLKLCLVQAASPT